MAWATGMMSCTCFVFLAALLVPPVLPTISPTMSPAFGGPMVLKTGADNQVTFVLGNTTDNATWFTCEVNPNAMLLVVSINSNFGLVELAVTNSDWNEPMFTGNRTSSRNPGITLQRTITDSTTFHIYVKQNMLFDVQKTAATARISAIEYSSTSQPPPGGCAPTSDFALATSTMLLRPIGSTSVSVTAYPAQIAPVYSVKQRDPSQARYPNCDFAEAPEEDGLATAPLQYQLYFLYAGSCGSQYKSNFDDNALISSVQKMTTLEGVLQYGNLQPSTYLKQKPIEWPLDIIPGQGVVYNVVVFDQSAYNLAVKQGINNVTENDFKAVYSPFATYHCSQGPTINCTGVPGGSYCELYPECSWNYVTLTCEDNPYYQSCSDIFDWHVLAFYMMLGVLGLFISLFGHRFFKIELYIFGFFIFGSGGYIGSYYDPILTPYSLLIAAASGIVGGFMLVYVWFLTRGVAIVMVIIGIVVGVFVTSFIFATALGEMIVWTNPFNFWMTYACLVLLWPIFMLLKDKVGNIFATSVSGSYLFLLAINYFISSSFDDILINTYRRATDPSFAADYTGSYFGKTFNGCSNVETNVAMLVVWVSLSIASFCFQWFVMRGRNRPVPVSDREDWHFCSGYCDGIPNEPAKPSRTWRSRVGRMGPSRVYASATVSNRPTEIVYGRPMTVVGGSAFKGHTNRRMSSTSANSTNGTMPPPPTSSSILAAPTTTQPTAQTTRVPSINTVHRVGNQQPVRQSVYEDCDIDTIPLLQPDVQPPKKEKKKKSKKTARKNKTNTTTTTGASNGSSVTNQTDLFDSGDDEMLIH